MDAFIAEPAGDSLTTTSEREAQYRVDGAIIGDMDVESVQVDLHNGHPVDTTLTGSEMPVQQAEAHPAPVVIGEAFHPLSTRKTGTRKTFLGYRRIIQCDICP